MSAGKKKERLNFNNNKKKTFLYVALVLIVLLGTYVRINGIITNSFSFTYDVGRDMLALNQIVFDHKIPLIGQTTGLAGLFYGPWWYYILGFPFLLVNGNPQGVAIFIALTGIASIVLGYILGLKINGAFLGITIAFLTSISQSMIGISSQIWNPNLIPLFVIIIFFLIFYISLNNSKEKNKNWKLFLLLGVFLGLILDMEVVFGMLFILSVIISLIVFLRRNINLKSYLCWLLGFIFILTPRILFDLRHNFLMLNSIISFIKNPASPNYNFSILNQFLDRLNIFYSLWHDTIVSSNKMLGLMLLTFIFIILSIFYKKLGKAEKLFLNFFCVILLTFFIGLVFFKQNVWSHYIIGIPVIYIFLLSFAINAIIKNIKRTAFLVIFLFLLLFWINVKPLNLIEDFKKPLWEGDAAVYRNQLAVVDYVYEQANGKPFNYIVYTPPVHDYTYQYLFLWYGNKKYKYTPAKLKAEQFFLIMEPDYENPSRLKDWLIVRKGDGKILKEETIKGGIKVQSRLH